MSDAQNIVIVTGASGTGIKDALSNFCATRNAVLACVEDYLAEVAEPLFRRLEPEAASPDLLKVLSALPHPALQHLWPEVFAKMWSGDEKRDDLSKISPETTIFLHFHALWYHVASDRFISEVSHPTLEKYCRGRTRMVITLLDDVYDTYIRLSDFGQIFWRKSEDAPNPLTFFVSNLIRLLQWREMEIRFAQQCAETLNVPHYILATKHPVGTFDRLVKSDDPVLAYLAHPISVPRRSAPEGYGGLDSSESQDVIRYISRSAHGLRSQDNLVLFEPTTIDELRFPAAFDASKSLTTRWPAAIDERDRQVPLLAVPLTPEQQKTAEQPFQSLLDREVSETELKEASGAVDVLKAQIIKQINWRDRQLVEQSDYVIQIRPFASKYGKASGGVAQEAKLHSNLIASSEELSLPVRGLNVIYHPETDESRRKRGAIYAVCRAFETRGLLKDVASCELAIREALVSEPVEGWNERSEEEVALGIESLFEGLTGTKPRITPGWGGHMEPAEQQLELTRIRVQLGSEIKQALDGICAIPEYDCARFRGEGCVRIGEEHTPQSLVGEIGSRISTNEQERGKD